MFLSNFGLAKPAAAAEARRDVGADQQNTNRESAQGSLQSVESKSSRGTSLADDSDASERPAAVDAGRINEALLKRRRSLCWRFPSLVYAVYVDRPPERRRQIDAAYHQMFQTKLITQLRLQTKPCSFHREAVVAVASPLADFYAHQLHAALSKPFFKGNEDLVQMLTTVSRQDLIDANYAYWLNYSVSLEFDIKSNIFGYFQRLLVNLSLPRRSELPTASVAEARKDAAALHEAGTDKTTFIRMFTTRSFKQLSLMFVQYKKLSGISIETAIIRFFNRKLKYGLLYIVKVARGRLTFLASQLYDAFKHQARDKVLWQLRVYADHPDDLRQIEYHLGQKHRTTLRKLIKANFSGDVEKLLLALVAGVPPHS